MEIYGIVLMILFIVYIICFGLILKKHKQNLKFVLYQAFISLCLMAIINLTCFATGYHIPVNECTVLGVSMGGIPAIILFLLLRIIFVL